MAFATFRGTEMSKNTIFEPPPDERYLQHHLRLLIYSPWLPKSGLSSTLHSTLTAY